MKDVEHPSGSGAMSCPPQSTTTASCVTEGEIGTARCPEDPGTHRDPHGYPDDSSADREGDLLRRNPSLMRQLDQAREQRGSPPLWDAVAARFDSEDRQREFVAPMLRLLDQIRERVDDETWGLIVDFEWRSAREVMAGIEVGLELGYENGRATALVEAQSASIPGNAAQALRERLADLLGDTEAEYSDVVLALLATLQGDRADGPRRAHGRWPELAGSPELSHARVRATRSSPGMRDFVRRHG